MGATTRRDAGLWFDDAGDGVMPGEKGIAAAAVAAEAVCRDRRAT